jgi:DNA repair protein RadC
MAGAVAPSTGVFPVHIRDWPASERPREKLLARGAGVLSDAELLALFLGSGLRGQDAVATARTLLTVHGPLRALLERTPAQLADLPGLGPARACQLAAALELCGRYLAAGLERGEALTDPHAAGRYFAQRLRGFPHEVFAALFLDSRHRALAFEELFRGTIDGAEVHPREVVRRALAHNAAAVIVGHNHPSGSAEPSAADRAVTARLKQSLGLVDIRLLDHFVVGDGAPVSLAARGWV